MYRLQVNPPFYALGEHAYRIRVATYWFTAFFDGALVSSSEVRGNLHMYDDLSNVIRCIERLYLEFNSATRRSLMMLNQLRFNLQVLQGSHLRLCSSCLRESTLTWHRLGKVSSLAFSTNPKAILIVREKQGTV